MRIYIRPIGCKYGSGFNCVFHVYAVCVLKCAEHSRAATLLMGSVFFVH
jgi:hypothetical protein